MKYRDIIYIIKFERCDRKMENMNMFPLQPGFLLPDGEYIYTHGKGHSKTAEKLLASRFGIEGENDPEFIVMDKLHAMLVRYCWGAKLLYLPKTAPPTDGERWFLKKAIKFYQAQGFQVINLYDISLDNPISTVELFTAVEDVEEVIFYNRVLNYTSQIVKDLNGQYMYNPERIGD